MHAAPTRGQNELLARTDVLVAEEDRAMIEQGLIDVVENLLIGIVRQVDSEDFRAHGAGEQLYVQLMVSHRFTFSRGQSVNSASATRYPRTEHER